MCPYRLEALERELQQHEKDIAEKVNTVTGKNFSHITNLFNNFVQITSRKPLVSHHELEKHKYSSNYLSGNVRLPKVSLKVHSKLNIVDKFLQGRNFCNKKCNTPKITNYKFSNVEPGGSEVICTKLLNKFVICEKFFPLTAGNLSNSTIEKSQVVEGTILASLSECKNVAFIM